MGTMWKSTLKYPKNRCAKARLKTDSQLKDMMWGGGGEVVMGHPEYTIVNDNIQTCDLNTIAEVDGKL